MRGFSVSFPAGAAGFGLVLLRCTVLLGLTPCAHASESPWLLVLSGASACLIAAGLLAPFAAGGCIACELACFCVHACAAPVLLAIAVLCTLALGLLGPGAYSMDARLFGRRRLLGNIRSDADRQP